MAMRSLSRSRCGSSRSRHTSSRTSILVRSLSPSIAAFLAVEISIVPLLALRVQRVWVPRGIVYDHDQGQAVLQAQIDVPNSWVRSMDGLGGVSNGHDIGRCSIHVRS